MPAPNPTLNGLTVWLTVGMYRISGSGWPDIRPFFSNPVPAKTVPGTGYLSRIVLGPFWQLVELSSPTSPGANARVSAFKLQRTSESCRPTVLHILVVDLCSV